MGLGWSTWAVCCFCCWTSFGGSREASWNSTVTSLRGVFSSLRHGHISQKQKTNKTEKTFKKKQGYKRWIKKGEIERLQKTIRTINNEQVQVTTHIHFGSFKLWLRLLRQSYHRQANNCRSSNKGHSLVFIFVHERRVFVAAFATTTFVPSRSIANYVYQTWKQNVNSFIIIKSSIVIVNLFFFKCICQILSYSKIDLITGARWRLLNKKQQLPQGGTNCCPFSYLTGLVSTKIPDHFPEKHVIAECERIAFISWMMEAFQKVKT